MSLLDRKEIDNYLPGPILSLGLLKHQQFLSGVQDRLQRLINFNATDCKLEALNLLRKWPLFGASFFNIQVGRCSNRCSNKLSLFQFDWNRAKPICVVRTLFLRLAFWICALAKNPLSIDWRFVVPVLMDRLENHFVYEPLVLKRQWKC